MDSSALKNEFLVESFENLSSISEDLTQLEKTPQNKDLLNKLYRTVHTMKGSASFLGYKKLQDITHSAENLLDELREEKFVINAEIIDTLLDTFDICNFILKALENNDDEGNVDIQKNKDELEILLSNKGVKKDSSETQSVETSEVKTEAIESKSTESDADLDSLISHHKSMNEPASENSEPEQTVSQEIKTSETTAVSTTKEESSNDVEGLSAAALDSLKELIGEGKMDSSVLEELNEASNSAQDEKTSVTTEEKPSTPVMQTKSEETPVVTPVVAEEDKKVEPVAKEAPKPEIKKSIADSFVRVNVKVLDKIMNIVGELVLNRNQIVQYSNQKADPEFSKLSQQLNVITSELQSEVMSTRMQPIGSILTKFERLVRDFSRQNDKKISLKLSGQDTELDKTLIEAIKDPLVHIIRNACDHGMETIAERATSNKSPEGTIHIKSYNESGQVTVEIVDDGRGLNRDKIGAKAIEKGVITQEKFERMSDTQIYNLIFAPGFSTAEKITNISGRGVGMDVVKTNIEKIGGSVSVNSEFGVGTTFKLRIPLTLAIVPALIIKSKDEAFAIPQLNLVELVRLETMEEKAHLETIQGSEFLKLRGNLTPVFRLNDELNLETVNNKSKSLNHVIDNTLDDTFMVDSVSEDEELERDEAYNIVILSAENHFFGIIVDQILDTEEIVVKPLSNSLKQLNLFGGATIMGDGKVALILDALGFLNTVSDNLHSVNADKDIIEEVDDLHALDGSEIQENLLFRLFDEREYAVPLSLVSRLEEFSVADIEMTGKQPIVRYLDAPMPLINIEKTLQLDGVSSLESYTSTGETALSCIVTTIQGKNFGIIVKEVLDISIDKVSIDDTAVDREGILGTIFIQDQTISLIDLYAVIEAQNIGQFSKRRVHSVEESKINHNVKILVVDDSPMYRKMETDLLLSMGFTVETANHGDEAFKMMQEKTYDLVITDIEMPYVNGYELAEKIRKELGNQNMPIVALSTCFSEEDKKRGKESGFTYHLEKFKKHEVVDLVTDILSEK